MAKRKPLFKVGSTSELLFWLIVAIITGTIVLSVLSYFNLLRLSLELRKTQTPSGRLTSIQKDDKGGLTIIEKNLLGTEEVSTVG